MTSRYLISRLLAGKNRLSRPEKDEILEAVLGSQRARGLRWQHGAALAVAGALAALLIVPMVRSGPRDQSEFSSKGSAAAVAAVDLRCGTGAPPPCASGDKLLFDLGASTGYGYFAAFARASDGTILWYFPESAIDRSLDLRQHLVAGVLDRSIILGANHPPGRYDVFAVFSQQPLSRDEIKARWPRVEEGVLDLEPGTRVARQELVIR